ncbi:MAG: hypothetical protein KJ626_10735 [Verrucomicrobia bacterium]|nr:hypothetical protein [Verrucomicrobiota bacterium]
MKAIIAAAILSGLVAGLVFAQTPEAKVSWKWYKKAKGYEEAVEIQKDTGLDMLVYFSRQAENEKGLCAWWEKTGMKSTEMKRFLDTVIKVEMPLPANPETQRIADQFKVGKTPAVYLVHPDGFKRKCPVFEWDIDKRPKLLEPKPMLELFVRASSKDSIACKKWMDEFQEE